MCMSSQSSGQVLLWKGHYSNISPAHPIDQSVPQDTAHIAPFLDPEANSVQTGPTPPSRGRNSPSPKRWQRHIPFTKKWYSSVAGPHDQSSSRPPYHGTPSALDPEGPDRSWQITAAPPPKRTSKMWTSTSKPKSKPAPTHDTHAAPTSSDEAHPHFVYRHGHGSWDSQISDTPTAIDAQHSPPQLLELKGESLIPHSHDEHHFKNLESQGFERNGVVEFPEPAVEGTAADYSAQRDSAQGIGSTLVPNFSRPELTGTEGTSRT